MDPFSLAVILLVVVICSLGAGLWVFVGLLLTALVSFLYLLGFPVPRVGSILTPVILKSVFSFELAAVPLFIWMGEIISGTNLAAKLFSGLAPWVRRLPGGLLHANVGGAVIFSGMSGSSVAATATIGKVATSQLINRGYDPSLVYGSITVAGTIGIMIPPSITLIIYGIVAEVSVAKLFAAGILPGLMLGLLYSGYIFVRALMNPALAPSQADRYSWRERFAGLLGMAPVLILVAFLLGSIYGGYATPSESASVGVFGAIVIAWFNGGFTFGDLYRTGMNAVVTTAMIGSALAAAAVLSTAIGFMHLPQLLSAEIAALNLPPMMLLLVLTVIYVILGTVLDGISMVLMTVPIVLPLLTVAGFDPIWVGVYLVLMVEVGLVTPPIGFNLFVLRSITGVPIGKIAVAALPFFLLMLFGGFLLAVMPQIALWLPGKL